jgi:hypothetical protein
MPSIINFKNIDPEEQDLEDNSPKFGNDNNNFDDAYFENQ